MHDINLYCKLVLEEHKSIRQVVPLNHLSPKIIAKVREEGVAAASNHVGLSQRLQQSVAAVCCSCCTSHIVGRIHT